jgi:hypothetical protein
MVDIWSTIVEFSRRELFYEPPGSALRNAVSYLFSFSLPLNERAGVRILRHVLDSFDHGALTGIRGSVTTPRQLMYNSESVFIDVRVEQQPRSDWVTLTGQVVDAQLAEGILEEIPILLFSRSDAALQTTTNQFGEFDFSFRTIEHPALLLNMREVALLLLLPEHLAGGSIN